MIHYESSGSGNRTLVFVHGLTCANNDWRKQVASLQSSYRCIGVDLRGHGKSAAMRPPYDCDTFAADVVALLHQLQLDNCVLIGHSMGTRVIAGAYLQAPERVTGLVFVDGSQQAVGDPQEAYHQALQALGPDEKVAGFIENLFSMMFTEHSDLQDREHIMRRAMSTPPDAFREIFSNMKSWDAGRLTSVLRQITIPLTVVQSTTLDSTQQRRCLRGEEMSPYLDMVRQYVPHADIRVVENTGHFTQLDAADKVNQAITDTAVLV